MGGPGMTGMQTSSANNTWVGGPNNPINTGVTLPMQQLQQPQIHAMQQQQQPTHQLQQQGPTMIRGQGPMVNMMGGPQNQSIRIMSIPQQPQMHTTGQPVQLRNLLMANPQQQQQQMQQGGGDPNVGGPPQQWMRQTGPQMMHGQMMMNRGPMTQGNPMGPGGSHPTGPMMMGPMRGGNPMGIMTSVGPGGQTAVVAAAQAQQQQQQQVQQHNQDFFS